MIDRDTELFELSAGIIREASGEVILPPEPFPPMSYCSLLSIYLSFDESG